MESNNIVKRSYTIIKWGFIPGMQGFYNIHKSISVIHHTNNVKDKKHIIKLIDTVKVFNKTQHPLMIKALQKVGIKVIYLNIKKKNL